jgi:enolase
MAGFTISNIKAREIIDNRGWPTIRASVCVEGDFLGTS